MEMTAFQSGLGDGRSRVLEVAQIMHHALSKRWGAHPPRWEASRGSKGEASESGPAVGEAADGLRARR